MSFMNYNIEARNKKVTEARKEREIKERAKGAGVWREKKWRIQRTQEEDRGRKVKRKKGREGRREGGKNEGRKIPFKDAYIPFSSRWDLLRSNLEI